MMEIVKNPLMADLLGPDFPRASESRPVHCSSNNNNNNILYHPKTDICNITKR